MIANDSCYRGDFMTLREQIEKYIPYNEQEERDKDLMLNSMDIFDDVLTRENQICHFTASGWVVNKQRTKVLMAFHNIYNSWAWTGGHADGEEDLCKVAIREVSEETGVQNLTLLSDGIYSLEVLTVDGHVKKGKYVSSHLHMDCCFLFEADEKEALRIKADENNGVAWVDIDKAPEVTNEEKMRPIYKKLNDKLKNV